MARKNAEYDTGYDDERFEQIVSQTLHCQICHNVLKDPVMCRHNEHIFCRGCITRHLMNSQTCPTCKDPLAVDSLTQVPQHVTNSLSELKIRCDFFDRGCTEFVELRDLEKHIAECGFAPEECLWCNAIVNRQDLSDHEVEHEIAERERRTDPLIPGQSSDRRRLERSTLACRTRIPVAGEWLDYLEQSFIQHGRSSNDSEDVTTDFKQLLKKLEERHSALHEESVVIAAGGENQGNALSSVEMFQPSQGTWTPLASMRQSRSDAFSVVHRGQMVVIGGFPTRSSEKLTSLVVYDQSIPWEIIPVRLPGPLVGHRSVIHDGRLIMIGGYGQSVYDNSITEISLVPPYTMNPLSTMPQGRCYHGVALFDDKILIVGGRYGIRSNATLKSVIMYDITKNECEELAPLPYPVTEMATVKWGRDNVIIIGGVDRNRRALNNVFMYNIRSQDIKMLPDMKYKRRGCVAVVVRDTVIVMGGNDEDENCLKSVEKFSFESDSWQELPEMNEARHCATAVSCKYYE